MICLDSSFIIDFLNKDTNAIKIYKKYSNEEFCISEITIFEIARGSLYSHYKYKNSDFDTFLDFINDFQILSTLNLHSLKAAKISASLVYNGKKIDDNDCIIAGTMIANNVKKIITKNKKKFSNIKDIEVLSY